MITRLKIKRRKLFGSLVQCPSSHQLLAPPLPQLTPPHPLPSLGPVPPQEDVRPQDTVFVIGGVAGSSKQGRKAAWKFVKDNWEELYNRYQGGFLISQLIKVRDDQLHASFRSLEKRKRVVTLTRAPFVFETKALPCSRVSAVHR